MINNIGKKGALRLRAITGIFSAVAFLTGFLFMDRGGISGNAIVTSEPMINTVSLAGLLLIFLAIGLGAYSIKK